GARAHRALHPFATRRSSDLAGRMRLDISSGVTIDKPFYLPKLQYKYGQSTPDSEESWGEAGSFSDPVKDFFDTGTTFINSVSFRDRKSTRLNCSHVKISYAV